MSIQEERRDGGKASRVSASVGDAGTPLSSAMVDPLAGASPTSSQFRCGRCAPIAGTLLIVLFVLMDSVSQLWFGYNQGVFAGVIICKDFVAQFPQVNDPNVAGIVQSCYLLAATFGSLAGLLSDRFGRRRSLLVGHGLNTAGAVLQVSAGSLGQMAAGRVINGFGMGITSSVSPVYLSESSPARLRGRLVAIGTSANCLAFAVSNWVAFGFHAVSGPLQWRLPLGLQLTLSLLVFPVLLALPESPRWLLAAGRYEEARAVLARLAGAHTAADDEGVRREFLSIKTALEMERKERTDIMTVLRCRDKTQNLRRLVLSCGGQIMQQLSGINVLGFWFPTLMLALGFTSTMSRLLTAVMSTIYVSAVAASLGLVDRWGRRQMFLFGSIGMGISFLLSAVFLQQNGAGATSYERACGRAVVASFVLYHVAFGLTWGTTPWVYAAEVNSLGWRTRGAAAGTAANWIFAFATAQTAKVGVVKLGWRFFLIYMAFCFAFFPLIYFFFPETANRTLEDMDEMFFACKSVFVHRKDYMVQRDRPQICKLAEEHRVLQALESAEDLGSPTPVSEISNNFEKAQIPE